MRRSLRRADLSSDRGDSSRRFPDPRLRPDRSLDGVGVDLDAVVVQEALEGCAPERSIADRLGQFGFTE